MAKLPQSVNLSGLDGAQTPLFLSPQLAVVHGQH
jgi:hypothetical protein